jgi:hypothetical protein
MTLRSVVLHLGAGVAHAESFADGVCFDGNVVHCQFFVARYSCHCVREAKIALRYYPVEAARNWIPKQPRRG